MYICVYNITLHALWYILCLFSLNLFVEVKALQGLCYLLYVYSTLNKSSMSMSMYLRSQYHDPKKQNWQIQNCKYT